MKHEAVTQSRAAGAETQRKPLEPTMLKHKEAVTVSGQHSQSAIHVAETARMNCDAETTSATMRRSCYTSRNNNTSFSSCNSIRLCKTRTSYAGLERRSDLG
jgi:hypothetical protein